ncbi:ABC transporter [Catellatospora sp. TT07R-123]|uniref:ABC transporter substrate-binding protein n=1 Tax=Catellatospora sp. TT07R-123 TaxID=2733863 RepID=UPI001B20F65F|nr:ABC transporter substrate-binding protein [Catellatospora sp. TT07R-123]GHJ47938.1 ABC transporter [Catellatospora sp. TT07R-123]
MRTRAATAAGAALALLLLAACTENKGEGPAVDVNRQSTGVIATDPAQSKGPAAEVAGAVKGGTFHVLRQTAISHLDPQRIYSFVGLMTSPLYARFLTTWKDDGKGHLTLVGDLAETPGTDVNKDCKTWEFKIKDGVKYEDGSAISAKDIAYGISRAFSPDYSGGPTYIQEWLADSAQFDKVWDFKANKGSFPPGLTAPDDKTLRFSFAKGHCDLPFAVSLPYTAPVPQAKDTGLGLDTQPFSSGPYKVTKNTVGTEIVLERNTNWDAATDPVRHQYPEKFVWSFGADGDAQANRIIADSGDDQAALGWNGVPASLVGKTISDASLKSRSILSPTPSANRLTINTLRVTDVNVRRALNYAIDREGLIKSLGGDTVASPMTTLMPSSTLGFVNYDAYPAGPNGNIEKAKELLAGKTPELVLGVLDTDAETGAQLEANLEKAGFKVTVKLIPADAKLDETSKKNNPWDLYIDAWAADWPSGASILPVLFDGRTVKDEGNNNRSFLNDDKINAEFDRVLAMDPASQAPEWAKLDKKLMEDDAPAVPLYVDVAYYLHGSKAGGIFVSSIFGYPAFVDAYVKS